MRWVLQQVQQVVQQGEVLEAVEAVLVVEAHQVIAKV
jgi:hypothetical protein